MSNGDNSEVLKFVGDYAEDRDMLERQAEAAFRRGEYALAAAFVQGAGLYAVACLLGDKISVVVEPLESSE